MSYLFVPPARPAIPVSGSHLLFPVRRIFCVARNYAAHAREMGHDPDRALPFFFCKPADAILPVAFGSTGRMPYPPATQNLHHEFELVVALDKGGRDLSPAEADTCVWGYACGFDMTRRDLQGLAKEKGQPWDAGKAFDFAAPISHIVPRNGAPLLASGEIMLEVNGTERQRGDLAEMTWNISETLAYLSRLWELAPGDLVFTGTPEGVGPVVGGDQMVGRIAGVGTLVVDVA